MSSKVFAGSAIKQNAGKISNINDWSPTTKQRRWLLIAGSSHPPEKVHISMSRKREAKGEKSGKYLQGISLDLFNMERSVGHTLKNKIQNLEITKAEVANHLTSFFQFCLENDFKPMLYYSNHGEMPTESELMKFWRWFPRACLIRQFAVTHVTAELGLIFVSR